MIQSFAELSFEARLHFAEELIKKINDESVFTKESDFKIDQIELDSYSNDLIIQASSVDPVKIVREACWQVYDEDALYDKPGKSAEYSSTIYEAADEALKTKSAVVDGYIVTAEVDEVEDSDNVDVQIDSYGHEDSGIGHHEFWGETGYDSHPYLEVEGTIIEECKILVSFYVSPKA